MDSTYSLEQNCQVKFVATTLNFVTKLSFHLNYFISIKARKNFWNPFF